MFNVLYFVAFKFFRMEKGRKPNGYWTKKRCHKEALEFNTRQGFRESSSKAYGAAKRRGWLDEVCSHMDYMVKLPGYWTKENCHKEALKYNSRKEFGDNCSSAYTIAKRKEWMDEICSHMLTSRKLHGYWTKKRCHEAALKCKTLKGFRENHNSAYNKALAKKWLVSISSHLEKRGGTIFSTKEQCHLEAIKYTSRSKFQRGSRRAYAAAYRKGWLDEVCSHMKRLVKPNGYWTKERCHAEALKHLTKRDFKKHALHPYIAAHRNRWLKEICTHMIPLGNDKKRMIYAYEFPKKVVYVGLTDDLLERDWNHRNKENSPVYRYFKKTNDVPDLSPLTGYLPVEKAQKMEDEFVKKYEAEGWQILNVNEAGALGGSILKWTKEKCREEALKYPNLKAFSLGSPGAYNRAWSEEWLDEISGHMKKPRQYNLKWTKKACYQEALKFSSLKEFREKAPVAYGTVASRKWLGEICSHLSKEKRPDGYWTKKRCHKKALKYNSRMDFKRGCSSAYSTCNQNGWLDEVCSHMTGGHRTKGYWTKENCQKEALRYKTRTNFKEGIPPAYSTAVRMGWLNEVCSHMPRKASSKKP